MLKIPLNGLPKLKDRRGFTLIELLMCILIISCLTTMGMMDFQDLRARASDRQALAEGKNLLTVASNWWTWKPLKN